LQTLFANINKNVLFVLLLLSGFYAPAYAQCPPNIDFEQGSFDGWTCYTGSTAAVGGQNIINLSPSGPVLNRHTLIPAYSADVDPYGGFPTKCPNGSGYSVKLGNDVGGAEAEGISYDFTIPANRNVYSLIYYYAVVFQDPNHEIYQQPRMVVDITNLTDHKTIDCSSFYFVPFGTIIPGFFESTTNTTNTPVWCKNWTAVTVNLNNMAGKTIRLFFKTADCTFQRHFGYAYLDVNSECSDEFTGALFCPDDTAVNVIAPYGYQSYTWYNNNFSQVLGSQQILTFSPPPPRGTTVAVEVVPYSGYGCLDTLYAHLIDTLHVKANAGRDTFSCNSNAVPIGEPPKQGFVYQWSPVEGLSDATSANPFASPKKTTTYTLTIRHDGGGCMDIDSVVVRTPNFTDSLILLGKQAYCIDNNDSAVLRVFPADSIQWYRDNTAILGANGTSYKALESGSYQATLFSKEGCFIKTEVKKITVEKARGGIRYPTQYAVSNLPQQLQARQFGDTIFWAPPLFLEQPNIYRPIFQGNADQEYDIHLITAAGCLTVDTQMVKIGKSLDVYVPSAFTPNNDNLNDLLRPTLMGIKELKTFKVFNRWGQLMYQTSSQFEGWNGIFNGKPQPTSVYVWMVEAIGADGRTYTKKGTSVLIR
jgi:gliding motility-associated-like protein